MAEQILYEEPITDNAGDPKDPLGLRKKLQQKADPLGLRKKMAERSISEKAPAIPKIKEKYPWDLDFVTEPTEIPQLDYSKPITEPKVAESVKTIPGIEAQKGKAKEQTVTRFTDELKMAQKNLFDNLIGNDDVYERIIRNERAETAQRAALDQSSQGYRSDMPSVRDPRLQFDPRVQQDIAPQDQPVTPEEIRQTKAGAATDELRARNILEYIGQYRPEKQKEIQSDLYKLDIAQQLENDPEPTKRLPKILQNAKELAKGELIYDARKGQLIKPENVIQSFVTGWKESSKAKEEYKKYKNIENNEAIAQDLDYEMQHLNPDEPIKVPSGTLSTLSSGLGYMPLKAYAAGAVGSLGGPAVGAAAAGTVAATDFYKLGWINEFKRAYAEFRKEGLDGFQAVTEARKLADQAGNVDAAVGALTTVVGLRAALRPLPKAAITDGFRKSIISGIKGFASGLSPALKEGIVAGGVGAGGEKYKNALAQEAGINRDADEHVFEVAEANLLLPLAIGAIASGAKHLTKPAYRHIMQGLYKVPDGLFDNVLSEYVSKGILTDEQAANVKEQVQVYKKEDITIPDNISPEARVEIKGLIERRNELEAQLEQRDKAFHPDIKDKIKAVEEQINAKGKDTVKVSKEEKRINELIDEATTDGKLQGIMADIAKSDPDGFMKMVADQALGRTEEGTISDLPNAEYAVREQYGNDIVDKAKEMFPLQSEKPRVTVSTPIIRNVKMKEGIVPEIPLTIEGGKFKGDFLEGKELIAEGSESTVYRDGDSVVKIGEPYNAPETFNQRVQDAQVINKALGDGSLELIGTYESANGTKNPIFRQKFVEGEKATPEQIDSFMESKGFEKKGNGYENDQYRFTDIDSDNAIIDANGQVHIIDAAVKKLKPKEPLSNINYEEIFGGRNKELNSLRKNLTAVDVESFLRKMEKEGIIKIDC